MKQFWKRCAAMLCTGLLLTAFPLAAAHAEEQAETEFTFPSGETLPKIESDLNAIATQNNGRDEYYAAALVGIFHGDEILYENYFGKTDIAKDIPADADSCFEWGSISKTLIWVSAFQLVEQGKLDLDRDVRDYLPDGFFRHLSYDEPITMMNLMNHNAGWQETSRPIWEKDADSIGSLHDELQEIEPAQIYRPGEVVAYSNYGAAVAGYVVECISGQDYCEYVHEHIFEPLGMEHTALAPTRSDNAFVAEHRREMHSYSTQMFLSKAIDRGTAPDYIPCYPAGAACGTINDLIRYGQALIDDSAPLFAHPETQQLMFTGTDFYGTSDIPMCCHGFWCSEHAVRTYGHTGGTLFGQANLEFDPVSKVGIAVMINEPDGNDFLNCLPELVFGTLSPETYGAETFGSSGISGYFLPARSRSTGLLRLEHYLSGISAEQMSLQKADRIGNGVLQLTNEDLFGTKEAALIGERTDAADHLLALESPSCDLIRDPFYLLHLSLLTLFFLGAVSAFFLMLIRFRLRRAGRWHTYTGAGAMTAGRIARILSVVLMLASYTAFVKSQGGIPVGTGQVLGIGQILCTIVCIGSALICIGAMLMKKENFKPMRYLPHCAMNALCVTAVVFFEMYKYWGI